MNLVLVTRDDEQVHVAETDLAPGSAERAVDDPARCRGDVADEDGRAYDVRDRRLGHEQWRVAAPPTSWPAACQFANDMSPYPELVGRIQMK